MKLQKNRISSDHIDNTVYSKMKLLQLWNLYWKYKISRLKATLSRQSFYSEATRTLQWDGKIPYENSIKSPHLAEPAHVAGPAHLTWTASKNISLFEASREKTEMLFLGNEVLNLIEYFDSK